MSPVPPRFGVQLSDDEPAFVMAAGSRRYRDVVQVIDAAKGAGVTCVGIVTEGARRTRAGG